MQNINSTAVHLEGADLVAVPQRRLLDGDMPQGVLGDLPPLVWAGLGRAGGNLWLGDQAPLARVGLGRVVGDLWCRRQESEMQLGRKEGLLI